MAKTQLADIIVPAQFAPYVLQRTAEKSDLFQSGIVVRNADYDARALVSAGELRAYGLSTLARKILACANVA